MNTRLAERHESIWMLAAAPGVWAAHFMLCYVTAAIWCAKVSSVLAPLGGVRTAIGVFTALALAGILVIGWIGYRAHRHGSAPPPHDEDTPEDRHRFMGFATLLLSGLSALAVLYAGLVPLFIRTCQ
jgi:threonine/homoserine/homoserine lactone efflux protein